jgi:hypothetical protein
MLNDLLASNRATLRPIGETLIIMPSATTPVFRPRHRRCGLRHRMSATRSLGVAALLIALAGCSGSDSSGPSVQPIEPILDGDIEILADSSGTAATLSVDTTIPVACSVVYGTDDSFGSIAVDNDMQGGAHQDHSPLLTGLVPDTEYQYVLQGADAAGAIYRSEPMTFRTPSAAESGLGTNLAPTGTIVGSSSQFSDAFAAENAIDGNLGTEWSSAGDGDAAWIELDLGVEYSVTAIAFRTRQMTDGSAITDTFTVTIDDVTFGPFATGAEPAILDLPYVTRTVRIDAEQTSGGNTGATEIEVFGNP